jgi:tetratricopeptide (TPR) repeat protein
MSDFAYAAFITYSHVDSGVASWLRKSLEAYRVPSRLVASQTRSGLASGRLGRVFLDREELSAGGDLGHSIREALSKSEHLIVVCSPAAAQSSWVNLEIQEFTETHKQGRILCVIVDGEPFASTQGADPERECFPPALGYKGGHKPSELTHMEPVAADIRPEGDGRRIAKLKLIAGLLGIELDALIRRDAQRRHRRLLGMSIVSAVGMVIMTALTFYAIDARNSERRRRAEAEDLIEFMLGDLRNRLEAVGRLDVLDSVGKKAVEYYSKVDLSEHADTALGRRARAFHLLGEVDDLRGNLEAAHAAFEEAYASTGELVRRSPLNGELIFDHAQSVYWVGYLAWRRGNYAQAEAAFMEYLSLANRLAKIAPDNLKWYAESGHASLNMGVYTLETGAPSVAIQHFLDALTVYQAVLGRDRSNAKAPWYVAQAHGWLADAYLSNGSLVSASAERLAEGRIYQDLLNADPGNQDYVLSLATSYRHRASISLQEGNVPSAIDDLLEAKRYSNSLASLDSENTLTAMESASILADLAEALAYAGKGSESIQYFDQADKIASGLIATDQHVLEWQRLWHGFQIQRCRYLLGKEAPAAIVTRLAKTIEQLRGLASATPQANELHYLSAEAQFITAQALARAGSNSEASGHFELARTELSGRENSLPPPMLALLGDTLRALGEDSRAEEIDARLEKMAYRHPAYARGPKK